MAAAGGSVSATLGTQTVKVTFAPNALAANATVTVTLYAAAGLPRAFAASARAVRNVPAGAQFMAGIGVDTGTVALIKPPAFALSGSAPPAATLVRLAGSPGGGFGDVDTATFADGVVTNDANPAYAGPSLTGGAVVYAFYAVAPAAAQAPPAIGVVVSGPASVDGGARVAFSAREADAAGFPVLGAPLIFAVDSPAIGTIDPAAGVLAAASGGNAHGSVIATDARFPARTGSLAVAVLSFRPAAAGDTLAYAGSLTRTVANAAISAPAAPVVQTETGRVAQTTTVAPASIAGQFIVTTDENDTLQLRSLETKTTATVAYEPSGAQTKVRMLQSQATDSNNAVYATTYTPASGLLAVLPEATGTFGPNDGSQTYAETDPGVSAGPGGAQPTTRRTTRGDGSYTEITHNDDGSANTAVLNADLSGTYVLAGGAFRVTVAPAVAATATATAFIPLGIARADGIGGFAAPQTVQVPLWYPASTPLTETDSIVAGSAFDPSCSVPARFGTSASKVQQAIRRFDPLFGTDEVFTSTSYDVEGVGTACIVLADSVATNYDYSLQEGNVVLNIRFPVTTTTYAETLSLTSATVAGQPAGTRGTAGVRAVTGVSAASAREAFLHAVRLDRARRAMQVARAARAATGRAPR